MRSCESGFAYLVMLLAVAVMGIGMGAAAELWQTSAQREKEKELLFIGHAFRDAIGRYYKEEGDFPERLEDLLQVPDSEELKRYLRKIYTDPITGSKEWGLLRDEDGEGGIQGVFSLSTASPMKTTGFSIKDVDFDNRTSYSDWKFRYIPE